MTKDIFWPIMIAVFVAIIGFSIGAGVTILASRHISSAPAPWGQTVPTDCGGLRDQARQFTQGAVSAGKPGFSSDPTARALVALAELQLWQANGCRP
jgi:hypothetical protein